MIELGEQATLTEVIVGGGGGGGGAEPPPQAAMKRTLQRKSADKTLHAISTSNKLAFDFQPMVGGIGMRQSGHEDTFASVTVPGGRSCRVFPHPFH